MNPSLAQNLASERDENSFWISNSKPPQLSIPSTPTSGHGYDWSHTNPHPESLNSSPGYLQDQRFFQGVNSTPAAHGYAFQQLPFCYYAATPGPSSYSSPAPAVFARPHRYHDVTGSPYPPGLSHTTPTPQLSLSQYPPQAESLLDEMARLEREFCQGIFVGIPQLSPQGSQRAGRKSRAQFQWPWPVDDEVKLLVMFNCMRRLGFETLGAYFVAIFSNEHSNQAVTEIIASFLRGKAASTREHPVSIVSMIYNHKKSQEYVDGVAYEPNFLLPRHALPPSQRLSSSPAPPIINTTRNSILAWSLQRILDRVDKEATSLTKMDQFTRLPQKPLTWDSMLGWRILQSQEIISVHAPVIFSMLTTISVSKSTRKKLEGIQPSASLSSGASSEGAGVPDVSEALDGEELDDGVSDSEQVEDKATLAESGVPDGVRRDPWLGATIALLSLLHFRYTRAIIFPILVGLFLFTCNANRDIISILSRAGLSVAYRTILASLHTLAADSSSKLHAYGAVLQTSEPTFLLLYDNVNKMRRAWQKSLGHEDELKSGTAATLIELEDVPAGALRSEPLLENLKKKKRGELTVKRLLKDIDWDHIEGVGAATVMRIWVKYIPALSKFKGEVEELFSKKYAKRPLRLRKSKIHTMRSTDIDEATTVGSKNVLYNLVIGQLAITAAWLVSWLIFICGDQLSIDRVRKIKLYMAKADPGFEQHKWALPVIQLWHLKWNWQKVIFRRHWWPEQGKTTFGLSHDAKLLRRDKFNPDKCDFYPAHHILEDRFEALILHALRTICEEKTKIIDPSTTPLTDTLEKYFSSAGPYADIDFSKLSTLADLVYRRYMCSAAYEDALGHSKRSSETYGPQPHPSVPDNSKGDDSTSEDEVNKASTSTAAPTKPGKKKRRAKKTATAEARNFSSGDQCLANDISFLRTTFWYLEMCAAVAEGDIGRVFEIIKVLRFSFWGSGSTNYGNELLELACNFFYEFPEELKTAILNNYLVNPSGIFGCWFELDLLQEHYNFWIKRLFNSKSHEFDSKHLSEAVGLNIRGFSALRDSVPNMFGVRRGGTKHTDPDKRDDINSLAQHFRSDKILNYVRSRNQPYLVKDEFAAGFNILQGGQLRQFLDRTLRDGFVNEEEGAPLVDDERLPANPITSAGGSMGIEQFNSD